MFVWGRFWGDNGFFDLSDTALSLFQGLSAGANGVNGEELFELNSNKDNAIGIFSSRFNSSHTNSYHIKFTYNSSSNLYDAEIIDSETIVDNNSSDYYNRRYYLDSEDNLRAYNRNSSNSLYSYYDFSLNQEVVDNNLTNKLTTLGFNNTYIEQIYDTKYFGQLVTIDEHNGTKFISNVQDPDGNCQIILSVDNTSSNNIYFDEDISEDSSGYLYALSSERSYDSNYNIENIIISENFSKNFKKEEVFDKAFEAAFDQLILTLLNSSDKKKIQNMSLYTIKRLIDSFVIKNESFVNNNYSANFTVNFNKVNTLNYFEKNNIFPSIPKKIDLLFIPVLIDKKPLFPPVLLPVLKEIAPEPNPSVVPVCKLISPVGPVLPLFGLVLFPVIKVMFPETETLSPVFRSTEPLAPPAPVPV